MHRHFFPIYYPLVVGGKRTPSQKFSFHPPTPPCPRQSHTLTAPCSHLKPPAIRSNTSSTIHKAQGIYSNHPESTMNYQQPSTSHQELIVTILTPQGIDSNLKPSTTSAQAQILFFAHCVQEKSSNLSRCSVMQPMRVRYSPPCPRQSHTLKAPCGFRLLSILCGFRIVTINSW